MGSKTNISTSEVSAVTLELMTPAMKKLVLRVFVPHPKFADAFDSGLVEPFASFIPPKFNATKTSRVDVNGKSSKLYETDLGACTLVIRADKSSAITLSADTCDLRNEMITAANKLTIQNFNSQLNS